MDILSILLKMFGIILIIVFIVVGIKLIKLIDDISVTVKNVNDEMLEYKKRCAPILKIFDSISGFAGITNGFVRKIFFRNNKKGEED